MTSALIGAGILAGGGLLQSGLNFASGVYSSQKQFDYAKAMARYQYDLQMKALQEQYTNARSGLEKAGYNPILAVQNGVNTQMGLSQAAAAPVDNTNVLSSATNAAKVLTAELDNINAQTNKVNQESLTEIEKRANLAEDTKLKVADTVLHDKQSSWYDKQAANEIIVDTMKGQAALTSSNAQQITAKSIERLRSAEAEKLERYNKWAKDHPYAASISETLERSPIKLNMSFGSKNYKGSHTTKHVNSGIRKKGK